MSLDHDLEQAGRERSVREKAQTALAEGKISRAEYDFFLRQERAVPSMPEHAAPEHALHGYAKPDRHKEHKRATATKALFVLLALGFGFALMWAFAGEQTPTGLVTFSPTEQVSMALGQEFTQDTLLALNVTNTTTMKLTGTLTGGTADVFLVDGARESLVYHGDASAPRTLVTTAKESYAFGEPIDVTVQPEGASFTLWLTDERDSKTPVADGFVPTAPGAYTLDALIDEAGNITKATTTLLVREDADAGNDIARVTDATTIAFTDACAETCTLEVSGAPLTLSIKVSAGAVLRIDTVTTDTPRTNSPPALTAQIDDFTVQVGESVVIDLDAHFNDADAESLTYDFMTAPGVDLRVDGAAFSVTGITPGTTQSVIYASDLYAIAQSNVFTITVLPGAPNATPETNATTNATTNETQIVPPQNTTLNETTTLDANMTMPENATTNVTIDTSGNGTANATWTDPCLDADINLRPAYCFFGIEDSVYGDVIAPLKDKRQHTVARFTRFGNLVITGVVHERSSAQPGPDDFAIGYTTDENFETVYHPTAWIDTQTGDLHLAGTLLQEEVPIVPAQYGSYIVQNKNGLILAYFKQETGDLHLKGNIVQLGRI